MRCDEIQTGLAEYSVGGKSRWQRWHTRRHLQRCADCQQELAALQRTGEMVATVELESAPEQTWAAIEHQIADSARARAPKVWKRWVAMAALSLVIVIMAVLTHIPWGGQEQITVQPMTKVDAEMQSAEAGHLSAAWSAPLSDPAAMGLRMESVEDDNS